MQRVTAISLRRRPDRWAACEEHLLSVLPPDLPFDMFPGTDAKAAAAAAAEGDSPVDALEQRTGCRVYRDWPITEVSDVHRCYPHLADLGETQAWVEYERCFSRLWRRDRARLYIDFFCRHLTLGDVGAALSHLRVAERAHAEGLSLQVVLEDDAHLTDEALPALLREVRLLEQAGVRWDLIYLGGSALYSKGVEPAVAGAPDSCLRVAGHRKVCMAYALSADGARKLATCGYRGCILPVDDLLPALHSRHPRADVMALACVAAARRRDDGSGEGEGDDGEAEDSSEESGFVALTFPDDAGLVRTRQGAGSDSKAGSGSAPLLGDCGVAVDCGRGEEAETAERPVEPAGAAATATGAAEASQPAAALSRDEAAGGGLAAQLRQRGYCRVLLGEGETATLREAEAAARALLALPEATLRQLSSSAEARRGRARDCGGSDLLNAGFSRWECRLQWHVVRGAPDAQLWPHDEQPHARSVLLGAADAMRDLALWCLDCLARNDRGGGGCDWAATLRRDCAALGLGTDGSVLDAFVYRAEKRAGGGDGGGDALLHMGSHTDPGVLTLKLASATAGLEVRDGATGAWVDLESGSGAELLVLAADALEHASGAAIRAAPHRVAAATDERLSLVYEMRAGPGSM